MLWGLLWIIGVYGASVAVLHAIYAWCRRKGSEPQVTYFALVTQNNQTQIEWYLRSLVFFSWLRGRQIAIMVFDDGSTDETIDIVRRFALTRPNVEIRVSTESLDAFLEARQGDAVIVHHIRPLGKDERLPVLQW